MKIKICDVIKVAIFILLFSFTFLSLIIICRTLLVQQYMVNSYCPTNENYIPLYGINHKAITAERGIFERLQDSLKIRTITRRPKNYDRNEILKFHRFLNSSLFISIN